ncbi:carbohydrate kinase [Spirochaetia bacterium]|nr:carbohydrate kinase [Spirochaetia bacterium]
MSEALVLSFDLGTQSLRSMLINTKGEILFKVQKTYEKPYYSAQPGWAEQKPELYWNTLCEASLQLKEKAGNRWDEIIAVTLSTIRDTCICLDKNNEPLRDIILWLDERRAEKLPPLPGLFGPLFKIAGLAERINHQRSISHCNWIMRNEEAIWDKTAKFAFVSSWLNCKLCGELADSPASMIGHIPYDSKQRRWMDRKNPVRMVFDIPEEKLVTLIEAGGVLGKISAKAAEETGIRAGLPLISTGSDKGCETLGLSCLEEGKASLSFGTTATVQLSSQKYFEPQPFMPAYTAVVPGYFNPEIEIYRGYWLLSWFKKEFAAKETQDAEKLGISAEKLLNQRLKELKPGCDGLILQPYFTPGVTMPYAKGAVIGFSDVHTRIHLYRAIIEGINFALMEGMRTMEKRGGIKVKEIYVAGGGSQSSEICGITASMFGLPVYRTQTHETTGVGAAIAAFTGTGVFKSWEEAVAEMVHIKDEFLPNKEDHGIYEELYNNIFVKMFDKLSPFYREIQKII